MPKALEKAFVIAERGEFRQSEGSPQIVGRIEEVPLGKVKIVQVGGRSIGIFHLESGWYAVRNTCPHQGAELCRGTIHETNRPSRVGEFEPALRNRVLRCPWHGWEFDVVTGKGLYDEKSRVATYKVTIDSDGNILLYV